MSQQLQGAMFKVDSIPCCVWDLDLHERNMEFINSINPNYFEYLAQVHFGHIEGENKLLASIALKTAYYHGLETLFTLLCATLQAPNCVYGWTLKSRPHQVRSLVQKIKRGHNNIFNKLNLTYVSWYEVSRKIHNYLKGKVKDEDEMARSFSDLWLRFSSDFLNEMHISEYNSIKHGFRASPGGFGIAVGLEETPGVQAPPEKMHMVGRSEFGSSFLSIKEIDGVPCTKSHPNFHVVRKSINWVPENLAHGLVFISMSINNVLSYLKILNGEDPTTCLFNYPENPDDFYKPWEKPVGVISGSVDYNISQKDIMRFSKEEILEKLSKFKAEKEQ